MKGQRTTTILITRPRLAGMLQQAGYELRPTRSPWDEARTVWQINLDHASADIITNYYKRIGRPAPQAVARYLKEGGL